MHFGVSFHFDFRIDWWDPENTNRIGSYSEMALPEFRSAKCAIEEDQMNFYEETNGSLHEWPYPIRCW